MTKDTASIAAKLIKIRKQQQEAEEDVGIPEVKVVTGLPWIPKAREKDIESFLNLVRQKFIGFSLPGYIFYILVAFIVWNNCVYRFIIQLVQFHEIVIYLYVISFGVMPSIPSHLSNFSLVQAVKDEAKDTRVITL